MTTATPPTAPTQPSAVLTDDLLEAHRMHPDNLSFALYLELCYMDTYLKRGNRDLTTRVHGDGKEVCDSNIVKWCEEFLTRNNRLPRVMDFGAGVISSLTYLKRVGLADLVAADALGPEFERMHALHGFTVPVPSVLGIGEIADEQFGPASFDLVHIRNALDHTQCPALTWLNLFSLVKVGGILCHSHAIREATWEKWQQLHQFDLFPGGGKGTSMWIEDRSRRPFSLTDGLPVAVEWATSDETGPKPWFVGGYRKLSDAAPSGELSLNTLWQLRSAFVRRSRWCFELEGMMLDHLAERRPGTRPVPIVVSRERM